MSRPAIALDRRSFLRAALVGATSAVAGAGLLSCSTTTRPTDVAPATQSADEG